MAGRVQADRDAAKVEHSSRMLRLTLSNLHEDVKALRAEIGGLRLETAEMKRAAVAAEPKEAGDGEADQA